MRSPFVSLLVIGISFTSLLGARLAFGEEKAAQSLEECELHGGHVSSTQTHHFETVFAPDGVRIFEYSEDLKPVPMDKVAGTVTITSGGAHEVKLVPNVPRKDEKTVYFCEMHDSAPQFAPGNCPKCHMKLIAQTGLFAAFNLSKAKPGSVKAAVHLTGLPGKETEVTFTESNAAGEVRPKPEGKTSPEHD